MENYVGENLAAILGLISQYEQKYQRKPGSVTLLAVSKLQPIFKIEQAMAVGQRCFGENYLQEALEKMQLLQENKLEWHFIGAIQSNKTKRMAEHFDWVHGIDDEKIAQRLNDQRPHHLLPLNICIEVNTSAEASKSGILPEHVKRLADYCMTLPNLRLRGLMTIPAPSIDIEQQRKPFDRLAQLLDDLQKDYPALDTLSMGMTEDFEAAIAAGATIIRIGTAIFGKRVPL